MTINLFTGFVLIIILIIILAWCVYIFFAKREGFQYMGYPPFAGPGYVFNFPTREYPPLTFAGYDLRGPPGCPYFGRCGESIRRGDVITPDKRFFYDYWWPMHQFRYDKFYGANGKIHDA